MALVCSDVLAIIGGVAVSYIALKVAYSLYCGLRAFVFATGINFKSVGQWAVVTGATDGIGKAYAHELARRGMNIVLVSRSLEKLEDVAKEIETKHSVKTKVIQADFSTGPEIYERIKIRLTGLEIGVLVNNVGMAYDFPSYFGELTQKKVQDLLNVNITSLTMMTHLVLPTMVERKKGIILNISSGSALAPCPLLNQYSAAKVYVDYFSRALQVEYESKGLIVQSVLPFFVATKLSKIRKSNLLVPTPEAYAKTALNTVGVTTRTFGCISHALQAYITTAMPVWLYMSITKRGMLKTRSIAQKKQQKKQ